MCEFCVKHGEGEKWYLRAQNYSEDSLSDLRRRKYIQKTGRPKQASFLCPGSGETGHDKKAEKNPPRPGYPYRRSRKSGIISTPTLRSDPPDRRTVPVSARVWS